MQDAIIMYENGKAIGGEGHPTDASDITFDNSNTDLVSENVEGAIKEVNAKTSGLTRMTTLWTNPSPTASFSAQTVTLASDDYDMLLITASNDTSGHIVPPIIIPKGKAGYLSFSDAAGDLWREVLYVDSTHITFGNGSRDNTILIPYEINGIKLI